MNTISTLYSTAVKRFHQWLREITHEEQKPITIDFSIPKKKRLAWISRTIK